MPTDPVLYEKVGRVVTITLNDPDRRNPVSDPDTIDALVGAVGRVQRDPEVSVAIVTGAGTAFSSGGDVKAMRDRAGMFGGPGQALAEGYMYGIQQIPLAIYGLDVPTIAAVNGPAMGAGCDLAFMCDMRIASARARAMREAGSCPGACRGRSRPKCRSPAGRSGPRKRTGAACA